MNRKGQALIEFVLILPVFLMILFVIFDFGMVFSSKNQLESESTDIVRFILKGKNIDDVALEYSDVDIDVDLYKEDYRKVIISKKVRVVTPFLDRVLGNPYEIKVERIIPKGAEFSTFYIDIAYYAWDYGFGY